MHAEYGPGNWQASGRNICDCDEEGAVDAPSTSDAGRERELDKSSTPLEYARDIKVRFRFKRLRLKDYDSEQVYFTQSIKRYEMASHEKTNTWRSNALSPDSSSKQRITLIGEM